MIDHRYKIFYDNSVGRPKEVDCPATKEKADEMCMEETARRRGSGAPGEEEKADEMCMVVPRKIPFGARGILDPIPGAPVLPKGAAPDPECACASPKKPKGEKKERGNIFHDYPPAKDLKDALVGEGKLVHDLKNRVRIEVKVGVGLFLVTRGSGRLRRGDRARGARILVSEP